MNKNKIGVIIITEDAEILKTEIKSLFGDRETRVK